MPACIFCGSTGKLTAEHLFGDWISWAFHPDRKAKQYRLYHRGLAGRYREWQSDSIDYKARLLCAPCNNEWFSDLEGILKPLVTPMMMEGKRTALSTEDQVALSAWIVKTMIVFNHMWDSDEPDYLVYSAGERKEFRDTLEPPPGVLVWLAAFRGKTPDESGPIVGDYSGFDPDTRQDMRGVRKYVLTFTLRQLAVQLLALRRVTNDAPSLDYLVKFFEPTPMWRPATIRIWPNPVDGIMWPPRAILTRQALQSLSDRYGSDLPLWPGEVVPGADIVPLLIEHDRPSSS